MDAGRHHLPYSWPAAPGCRDPNRTPPSPPGPACDLVAGIDALRGVAYRKVLANLIRIHAPEGDTHLLRNAGVNRGFKHDAAACGHVFSTVIEAAFQRSQVPGCDGNRWGWAPQR